MKNLNSGCGVDFQYFIRNKLCLRAYYDLYLFSLVLRMLCEVDGIRVWDFAIPGGVLSTVSRRVIGN